MVRPLIAGNWKMNGTKASLDLVRDIMLGLSQFDDQADCLVCPPSTLLAEVSSIADSSRLFTGGQDCHAEVSGAHTGDVSADMIADAGGKYVILGHSERRADHHETSDMVATKTRAAIAAGLTPIICVGESLDDREAGQTIPVITAQIQASLPDEVGQCAFVVAYEPIWAIGTGRVATPEQVSEVHSEVRTMLTDRFAEHGARVPILYGGSMKPGNAAELLALNDVNGGLIGGASLNATDFLAIYSACISNL